MKKIAIFKVDIRSHGTIVFWASPLEGDVEKRVDFQKRKIRSHCPREETSHAWFKNVSKHATRLS